MPQPCEFPCCPRQSDRSGGPYCTFHKKLYGSKEIKAMPEPIAKRSEALTEKFKGYKKQLAAYLAKPENKYCKIDSPVCTKIATAVHHVAGRTGPKLKDEKDWMACCAACNGWVEENDAEARQMGAKKTRLTKVEK